jgi:NAD(P)-dependent dehydrogenase (short-subunit alcohol dehydrogenase family)
MGRLDGKVAIVTGGGSGIGRDAARRLAAEGARVVVAGRRRPPLDEVVAEIEAAGGRAAARPADLAKPAEALALADWTRATWGPVEVLVNNAGESSRARSIRWIGPEEWERVFAINVHAVYTLTQAVLPGMLERGGGTVITVSSVAALRASLLSGPAYGAAKAAAAALMRSLHEELRARGIRATTIFPAEVDTPIMDKRPRPPDATARAAMMRPEDVADVILLCVTMPARTVIEQVVMHPTRPRDLAADIEAGLRVGKPDGVD